MPLTSTPSYMVAPSIESNGRPVPRSPPPSFSRQWKLLLVDSDETPPTLEARDFTVTRCATAQESISILRERSIDLVLVDAAVADGFKLVKRIAKHTNVLVAMMSSSRNEEVMRKGFEKGACDFFVKPVNVEDLRNSMLRIRPAAEQGQAHGEVDDHASHAPPAKRRRVIWAPELHSKFVEAVDLLGITKAVPKKILEIMNVPGLTRENVASHLQKYRQHCKKQEENSQKQVTGVLLQGATFDPRPPAPVLPPMRLVPLTGRVESRAYECGVGANQMPRVYSECTNLHQEHKLQPYGGHVQPFNDMGYTSMVSSVSRNCQMIFHDNADFYGQHHRYSVGTYGADVYQPPSVQHPNNQPVVMGDLPEPFEQSCVVNPPPLNASLWEDYVQDSREVFVPPQMQRGQQNCFDDYSYFRPRPCTNAYLKTEHQFDPLDTNANTIIKDPCPQVNQIPKSEQPMVNQIPKYEQLMDPTNQDNGEFQEFDYIDAAVGFDWNS